MEPVAERREDVLAAPTRARLFRRLAALGRPAAAGELADELGLHPSGVRVHLERLRQAGLVVRQPSQPTRGRPRNCWQVAPDARPGTEHPEAYRMLARWLARSIPPTPERLREVEQTGRQLGRELLPGSDGGPGTDTMGRVLTALGFAPQREPSPGRRVRFRLGSCPYREAVRENQPAVCALHRGLTEGLVDELDPDARLVRFVAQDPDQGGCVIEVAGL